MTNNKAMTRTKKGMVVLGQRCTIGHGGNRSLAWGPGDRFAECCGCGNFVAPVRFASREEALAADEFRAVWPLDTAADVLAGLPR